MTIVFRLEFESYSSSRLSSVPSSAVAHSDDGSGQCQLRLLTRIEQCHKTRQA